MKRDLLALLSPQLDRAITRRVLSLSTLSWMWCAKRPPMTDMQTTLHTHVAHSYTYMISGEKPAMQRPISMCAYVM